MKPLTLSAQTLTKKSFQYYPLNSEISVCKFLCQEQLSEDADLKTTGHSEFFALTAEVKAATAKGIEAWAGLSCAVPANLQCLYILPASLVARASQFSFHSTYGADPNNKKGAPDEQSQVCKELHRYFKANQKPFTWLQSLEKVNDLGLYWVDWGNFDVYALRGSVPDKAHMEAVAPAISLEGSVSLPLRPIALAIRFGYIHAHMDNGHYDLESVAKVLFEDTRTDLSKRYESATEAIESIPYYNAEPGRNKCLEFDLCLSQEDFEAVQQEAFGFIKLKVGKKGSEIVSSKAKYITSDAVTTTVLKMDLLKIAQFKLPQAD